MELARPAAFEESSGYFEHRSLGNLCTNSPDATTTSMTIPLNSHPIISLDSRIRAFDAKIGWLMQQVSLPTRLNPLVYY